MLQHFFLLCEKKKQPEETEVEDQISFNTASTEMHEYIKTSVSSSLVVMHVAISHIHVTPSSGQNLTLLCSYLVDQIATYDHKLHLHFK